MMMTTTRKHDENNGRLRLLFYKSIISLQSIKWRCAGKFPRNSWLLMSSFQLQSRTSHQNDRIFIRKKYLDFFLGNDLIKINKHCCVRNNDFPLTFREKILHQFGWTFFIQQENFTYWYHRLFHSKDYRMNKLDKEIICAFCSFYFVYH